MNRNLAHSGHSGQLEDVEVLEDLMNELMREQFVEIHLGFIGGIQNCRLGVDLHG